MNLCCQDQSGTWLYCWVNIHGSWTWLQIYSMQLSDQARWALRWLQLGNHSLSCRWGNQNKRSLQGNAHKGSMQMKQSQYVVYHRVVIMFYLLAKCFDSIPSRAGIQLHPSHLRTHSHPWLQSSTAPCPASDVHVWTRHLYRQREMPSQELNPFDQKRLRMMNRLIELRCMINRH